MVDNILSPKVRADLLLLLITIIWGATFPLISASLPHIHAFVLVALRFGIASVFFLPFVLIRFKYTNKKVLWAGFILGILNAAIYLLQTFGMRHVNADATAFIAASGVVMVPFMAPFFGLGRVKKNEIVGSVVCLAGLYILTGAHFNYMNSAEGFILLAAVAWAMSICYVQKVTPNIKELKLLAFYQILFLLPFAGGLMACDYQAPVFTPMVIFTILYTGILATAVVFLLQMRYQKDTTATHAAIIYSLEPVFASIIAVYVNHLSFTEPVLVGGGLILLSVLMIELLPKLKLQKKL